MEGGQVFRLFHWEIQQRWFFTGRKKVLIRNLPEHWEPQRLKTKDSFKGMILYTMNPFCSFDVFPFYSEAEIDSNGKIHN